MNSTPLVSVVCLCHNHEKFVEQSVASIINQSYKNIEIIIVDDASTDGSKKVIHQILQKHSEIPFIDIHENIGNCKAFNQGLLKCNGEFVIDLAADDLLEPQRIQVGVDTLCLKGEEFGVHYGDTLFIDDVGNTLGRNSEKLVQRGLSSEGPEGDIYKELLARFFMSSPSMMSRRKVFDVLHGYDENLAYEDLDFWIRSSRVFKYCYTHEVLVQKRVLPKSLSAKQYKINSAQMESTYWVCMKAFGLNKSEEEDQALIERINYEMKWCLTTLNFSLLLKYIALRMQIKKRNFD